MAEQKLKRLSKVAKELNVGISTITSFLDSKGYEISNNPNTKITGEQYDALLKEFNAYANDKKASDNVSIGGSKKEDNVVIKKEKEQESPKEQEYKEETLSVEELRKQVAKEEEKSTKESSSPEDEQKQNTDYQKLSGPTVLGKIDLNKYSSEEKAEKSGEKEEGKKNKEEEKEDEDKEKDKEDNKIREEETTAKSEEKTEEKEKDEKNTASSHSPQIEIEKQDSEDKKEHFTVEKEEEKPAFKGIKVVGKIDLPTEKPKKVDSKSLEEKEKQKKRRKRIRVDKSKPSSQEKQKQQKQQKEKEDTKSRKGKDNKKTKDKHNKKEDNSTQEIQEKIKQTLSRIEGGGKNQSSKPKRKGKKDEAAEREEEEQDSNVLEVTEYISANDLAALMNVSVNDVIKSCMDLGIFVSINQRLDAETIDIIADEYGYSTKFISAEEEMKTEIPDEEEEDNEEDMEERAPIVTIMGHVDHGKTSLLDYIRNTKVTSGEAGGITQHIGAYDVLTDSGKPVTFLDTPGHEAFTAMRARGAKVTDVVIIVVSADDHVMPQTKEAINHAQVAGVPIIIAINKVDKPGAQPDKIREELANENILVEEWGGKYQSEEISAKSGNGISNLLEKVLLEAEILDLKANPNRKAAGTVVESWLDKGKGYITTILVQKGTLKVGDILLVGAQYGRVRAMMDHTGASVKEAGPSRPVQVLGVQGATQSGDKAIVMESEREAREIATKRQQILREQSVRTKKHITLDEIGRRLAIGNFQELKVIIKADVDGSIEALSDSIQKLSTEEIQVNIIHKGVGQITESDVLLASASDAIIIGFQVRPSKTARKLSEQEEIEIRNYSVIYDVINDLKDAMEGMLAPKYEEENIGNAEVREVFKISKIGTVAGCYVTEGVIKRNAGVRIIRDGIVVHTGTISELKRFKDDVNEVKKGYECGISIKNYNDIKMGDVFEAFEEKEIKRKLKDTKNQEER